MFCDENFSKDVGKSLWIQWLQCDMLDTLFVYWFRSRCVWMRFLSLNKLIFPILSGVFSNDFKGTKFVTFFIRVQFWYFLRKSKFWGLYVICCQVQYGGSIDNLFLYILVFYLRILTHVGRCRTKNNYRVPNLYTFPYYYFITNK